MAKERDETRESAAENAPLDSSRMTVLIMSLLYRLRGLGGRSEYAIIENFVCIMWQAVSGQAT